MSVTFHVGRTPSGIAVFVFVLERKGRKPWSFGLRLV